MSSIIWRGLTLPTVEHFYRLLRAVLVDRYIHDPSERTALGRLMQQHVPFELLMQQISDTLLDSAPDFVPRLLTGVYGQGEPNDNHRYLIELLVARRIQVLFTTNFDDLLWRADRRIRRVVTEAAFATLAAELAAGTITQPTVAHLHGSVCDADSLVATMGKVGKELLDARADALKAAMRHGPIVLMGYSESDQDITPILQRHGPIRTWRLVRNLKDRPGDPCARLVNLNPIPTPGAAAAALDAARRVLETHLRRLEERSVADLNKAIGAIFHSTSAGGAAAARIRRGLAAEWSDSAALICAEALGGEHVYRLATQYLAVAPPDGHPLQERWLRVHAFHRRHMGELTAAAREFAALRQQRERHLVTNATPEQIRDVIDAAVHEVETDVLIASGMRVSERTALLAHCDALLARCGELERKASYLPPTWETHFYHAEVALCRGDWGRALSEYRIAEDEASYWLKGRVLALVRLRRAVALRALGRRDEAVQAWHVGLVAARETASTVAMIQYYVMRPVLDGVPVGWYWLARRLAARLYPFYGAAKYGWLRWLRRSPSVAPCPRPPSPSAGRPIGPVPT